MQPKVINRISLYAGYLDAIVPISKKVVRIMRRVSISFAVFLLVFLQLSTSLSVLAAGKPGQNKVIIGYHTPPGQQEEEGILASGGKIKCRYKFIPAIAAEASSAAIQKIKKDPNVKYVEPDFEVSILQTLPNDPGFNSLWGLHNTGQMGGMPDADMDAPEAWDIETGSSDVVIAVIDTGVDYNHEDLSANMWTNPGEIPGNGIDDDNNGYVDDVHGWDFCNNDSNPMDDHDHGTHCSGTIAAVGNNGVGIAGVNWTAKIMAIKFLSAGGSGSTSDAILSVQYATTMKLDYGIPVIATSNSWGGGDFSQALENAIAEADAAGILFVAGAGNEGMNNDIYAFYPANHNVPNVIAVAATDDADYLAWFSNYGSTTVDLAAPGVGILSTVIGNGYSFSDGTSMAAPHVSGLVGLVKARFPGITHHEIKDRILGSVNPVPDLQGITVTGGRVNAWNALDDDSIPPAEVTDLAVIGSAPSSVTLVWTATGDDGSTGTASSYDVRYSTSFISDANWGTAAQAVGEPNPQTPSSMETYTVPGLSSDITYYFALKVKDNVGNESGLSNVVEGSTGPDDFAPIVTITSPADGSEVSGIAGIEASASDNVGVTAVEFYLDGELKSTDMTSPYIWLWDTRTVADDSYTVETKAYDAAGNVGSDQISVIVNNADTIPPTATITNPANGSEVSGTVIVMASASDNVGVTKVEFYVDGELTNTDTISPYNWGWDTTTVADGSHTLEAKAYDAYENVGSDQISVTVSNADTTPPTATITNPADDSEVSGTVIVMASASDNEGVAKVEFYLDGVLKATDTVSPYMWGWNTTTTPDGSHTLQAKAYDDAGNVGTDQVTVTVSNADTTPPTATITDPADGSEVSGTVIVMVSASDNEGIAKVEFYIDGVLKNTDTISPYSWGWDTTTMTDDSHTIEAKAYDAAGNTGSDQISVIVSNVIDTPPTVTITNPAAGSEVSGTVAIEASASDDVGVTKVEFYVDGVLKNADTAEPYSWDWDTTTVTNGSHIIKAEAHDTAGNTGSDQISVIVSNVIDTPPTVTITSPANGSEVSGTVIVMASASDDVGVSKVEFYLDGVLTSTDTVSPYSWGWNTTTATDGSHTIDAKAYDGAGQTDSDQITVTVSNADSTPPTATITNPADGSEVSGTVIVMASASDNEGVTKVEFYMDGELKSTDTVSPYMWGWNTTTVTDGSHTVEAKAYDAAGNTGSDQVTVTVSNADTTPPTATITNPADGSEVSGTVIVMVSASDNEGITKVEFYLDGELKSTDTVSPYNWGWYTTTATNDSHTVEAKAYDAAGNTGSDQVTVTVNNVTDTPPTVTITNPEDGSQVNGTVAIEASASDDVGVTKVEFYVDGVLKNTDTADPYSWDWDTTTATNDSHTIEAKAYDTTGKTDSDQISVIVSNVIDTPPTVTITNPADGSEVSGTVIVMASASDDVGVTKVEFYLDGALKGTDTVSPYMWGWYTTTTTDGSHTVEAKAYDTAGNTGSDQVTVTVSNADTTPPTASITNPADGSVVSGTVIVMASASDNEGVAKVEFYLDGALKGTDTVSPYMWGWYTTTTTDGSHTVEAKAYDAAGNVGSDQVTVTVSNSGALMMSGFALKQNFPNPLNPDTWIPYQLVEASDVIILIHDVSGQLVRKLALGKQPAGFYTTRDKAAYWDGRDESGEKAASGLYFYTIRAGRFTATRKMILVK
jgi:subtilisin family serine protease